jgi:hypothetical protein
MADDSHSATFDDQELRRLLEGAESRTAKAMERLVAGEGFSELLVTVAENAAALSKITGDVWDLMLRNLRVASRADVNRLARQLGRSEDKLELLLQAIERLEAGDRE